MSSGRIGWILWYPKRQQHGQVMERDSAGYFRVRFRDGTWGRYAEERICQEFRVSPVEKYPVGSLWPAHMEGRTIADMLIDLPNSDLANHFGVEPGMADKLRPMAVEHRNVRTNTFCLICYTDGVETARRVYKRDDKKRIA